MDHAEPGRLALGWPGARILPLLWCPRSLAHVDEREALSLRSRREEPLRILPAGGRVAEAMSGLAYWLADHVELWRPFALAGLGVFVLVLLWCAVTAWEGMR